MVDGVEFGVIVVLFSIELSEGVGVVCFVLGWGLFVMFKWLVWVGYVFLLFILLVFVIFFGWLVWMWVFDFDEF